MSIVFILNYTADFTGCSLRMLEMGFITDGEILIMVFLIILNYISIPE